VKALVLVGGGGWRGVKFPPVSVLGCFVGRVGGVACLINLELLCLFKDVVLEFPNIFGDMCLGPEISRMILVEGVSQLPLGKGWMCCV